jgi:hypothetical protein
MRLFVLNEDLRILWEGLGYERTGKIYSDDGELLWAIKPGELVLTPSATEDKGDPTLWLLVRGQDGSAFFFSPTKWTDDLVYLTKDEVRQREEESGPICFISHIQGPSRWFKQVTTTHFPSDRDIYLSEI